MTRSSCWKEADSVNTRRYSDSWRTDTSSCAVVKVIFSSPDDVMLLSKPLCRNRCGSRKCQRTWKLIQTKVVTLWDISEKEFVLFQPRCGHHRYKTSINKGSLGASSVHHASPGILPHGAGGNASERRFFIVFLLLDLVTNHWRL